MSTPPAESPETQKKIFAAYRDYFDKAEKKRRWNAVEDIPWDQANTAIDANIADVVQTFCMVELFLPDYIAKQLPDVRANKGRSWMLANWGYEESKHSMVLEEWLVRSGHRTRHQIEDFSEAVADREWNLKYHNARAAVIYTMMQELATQLNYRNLRKVAGGKDPCLDKVLELVSIDEAAHAQFFRNLTAIYLEEDRDDTLEQFRLVANTFSMPANDLLADGRQRVEAVKSLNIFDERIFFEDVYTPLLGRLGLTKADLKQHKKVVKVA